MANRNFRFIVSYDGTRYYGWEHQPNTELTIQGKLETVLGRMLAEEAAESKDQTEIARSVTVIGAGRTDAGVHARAMTANALLSTGRTPAEIQRYMNRYLPDDISINDVSQVSDRFHSRYNAIGKTYRYTLWYSPYGIGPVFDRKYVWALKEAPEVDRMREAARQLTGTHDYKSFCGNSHIKKALSGLWIPSGSKPRAITSASTAMATDFCRAWCGS